jgi:hypothetical protein
MMIHGGSVLSLTATAAETQQVKALPATYIAAVSLTGRKKFSLYNQIGV